MDVLKTLTFLDELAGPVGLALTEARAGRFAVVNKVMSNPALGHYMKSVGSPAHNQPRYHAETWARCFPTLIEQANAIREEYEALATGNLDIGDITVPGGNVSL